MKKILIIFAVLLFALAFAGNSNAQTNNSSNSSERKTKKNEKQEKDKPLKIKRKSPPEFGNCSQGAGLARLRVVFDKSAKVTNVEIAISSGCDSFDNNAIKAAKRIKFEPAIKNGEPITVTKLVEYTFRKF